jgi:sulfatase modifying factor 1
MCASRTTMLRHFSERCPLLAAALAAGFLVVCGASEARSAGAGPVELCGHCPELVAIPAGSFVMGASPGEEAREHLAERFRHRSEPQRAVAVAGFLLGRFEVTRGQYRVFAEATGRKAEGCFVSVGSGFEWDPTKGWSDPGYAQQDAHPVACVSWEDAQAYVQWLSETTGRKYRLPSEAEWEYAARAATGTSRFWGDDAASICEFANLGDAATAAHRQDASQWPVAACNDGHPHTAPVGGYRSNAFGLHDVLGNVEEWTQDCWNGNHEGAPADARARQVGDCSMRVVRGGAWDDAPLGLRAAYRVGSPATVRVNRRGLRVAADAPSPLRR